MSVTAAPSERPTSSDVPCGHSFGPLDTFARRHIGPSSDDITEMLRVIGAASLEELIDQTIPASIRLDTTIDLTLGGDGPLGEREVLDRLRQIANKNQVFRSFIGQGYSGTITPAVIQRSILEDPGWYTPYTPYQAEIAQGRLEALLNFQTMVADLAALPLAGASLLDEATAAAEAMAMCYAINRKAADLPFFATSDTHPQTLRVLQSRAAGKGIDLRIIDLDQFDPAAQRAAGILIQNPASDGTLRDLTGIIARVHEHGALVVVAADILSLALVKPPGEMGADIAVGSTQRFGVPMGCGGPHAAYIATRTEHARKMPGRIIGISRDALGQPALRMAIQTREQHIRRDKATSNICTAQALLATMAGMYAVYHGPEGLRAIAQRVHDATCALAARLSGLGHTVQTKAFFDTIRVQPHALSAEQICDRALAQRINLRCFDDGSLGIALDETVCDADISDLIAIFDTGAGGDTTSPALPAIPSGLVRTSAYLTQPVFNAYHSETELLRYIERLRSRDLSLAHSMIPLGSCTMKLNAACELMPLSWPEFGDIHPFAPDEQTRGYQTIFSDLERALAALTGFEAVSLQPNAGAQGEYAGLSAIGAYHRSRGDDARDVCLIPTSAHGTNPASAVMAGCTVVTVACDRHGNIDLDDLRAKASQHAERLAALMVTYPSTHGVFEPEISDMCRAVHDAGGLVYMDGANMNAQLGLTTPARCGADVCHLNLHKTFCIPHGGGGPGMGPICVTKALAPFLPGDPREASDADTPGPVAAAAYGSPLILTISWVYIALMGIEGLTRATQIAILNANYMARRLSDHFDILYSGVQERVAHEFILDTRAFEHSCNVKVDDIAKRLMDYGYHAPTMSFPVPGTLMIEPTESESKAELDRFCDALIAIRNEIKSIEDGTFDKSDNPLTGAPHPARAVCADDWVHAYSREQAAYPAGAPWLREFKFWPAVARIDNPWGDRNLCCSWAAVE